MNLEPRTTVSTILQKVPEATLVFWIIKIFGTTVGETAADFLSFDLSFGLVNTLIGMSLILVMALAFQFRSNRYEPWKYWLSVVLISVVGTLATDALVDILGVSLVATTVFFSGALIATFVTWYAIERTLSIHSIVTKRREIFYWAAILFTFALGTASGDLVSEELHLGYVISTLVFAGGIAMIAGAYYVIHQNPVTCFWTAYIMTRPLGASVGDWLTQAPSDGGLGVPALGATSIDLLIILVLVAVLSFRQRRDRLT